MITLCVAVPTVVQRHAQQKRSHLTNYDRFCGKTDTNVPNMIKSLLPQELQHLHRTLPEEGERHHYTIANWFWFLSDGELMFCLFLLCSKGGFKTGHVDQCSSKHWGWSKQTPTSWASFLLTKGDIKLDRTLLNLIAYDSLSFYIFFVLC